MEGQEGFGYCLFCALDLSAKIRVLGACVLEVDVELARCCYDISEHQHELSSGDATADGL